MCLLLKGLTPKKKKTISKPEIVSFVMAFDDIMPRAAMSKHRINRLIQAELLKSPQKVQSL